jgi:hypothetical protein
MNNKRTIERIATMALAAFLVGYFCYQVAYGTNESSYKYGFKAGREGYDSSNFDNSGIDTNFYLSGDNLNAQMA